jgi:hypothetical protein
VRPALLALGLLALLPSRPGAQPPPEIVCVQCHGKQAGRTGAPVALWKQSVHAENGIGCDGCHGGDPRDEADAMSPARGFIGVPAEKDIPRVCGKCHVGVMNDYLASAHGQALGSGGPSCVTCHGNHKVLRASLDLINEKDCSRCHGFERARILRDAMKKTEGSIVSIDGRIRAYKAQGADVDRIEKGLFALRNRFHTLFHDQDVDKVWNESTRIDAELSKLGAALGAMDETRSRRRSAGAVAVGAALLAALLFRLLKKTYD